MLEDLEKKYREQLDKPDSISHSHWSSSEDDFTDKRDSFFRVYVTLFPFLAAEYIAQKGWHSYPSGLIFPIGFLLFWAFYYTYYQPGLLEEKLSDPSKWDWASIPALLIGVLLWFLKVTIVELADFLLLKWVFNRQPHKPKKRRRIRTKVLPNYRYEKARPHKKPPVSLPTEIQQALNTMGIGSCRNWHTIHHRYRSLAKQYHPDLNQDITDIGRRFMKYDSAYRVLHSVKDRYFKE